MQMFQGLEAHLAKPAPNKAGRHVLSPPGRTLDVEAVEGPSQQPCDDAHAQEDGHLPDVEVEDLAVLCLVVIVQPAGRSQPW